METQLLDFPELCQECDEPLNGREDELCMDCRRDRIVTKRGGAPGKSG